MVRRALWWLWLAVLAGCGDTCAIPQARDGGPLSGLGEPCSSHWDCELGLACTGRICQEPGSNLPDAWSWDEPDAWSSDALDAADAAVDAGADALTADAGSDASLP